MKRNSQTNKVHLVNLCNKGNSYWHTLIDLLNTKYRPQQGAVTMGGRDD
jgi:hypothetical protein